ncbi:unnamed protein product [Dicrocoelium dendriticum]|nr:unnamed protein product [Dicrocoelium dendriticum]
MGKHRGKHRRTATTDPMLNVGKDDFAIEPVPDLRAMLNRLRRQRKRFFKRYGKIQFATMCEEITSGLSALNPFPASLPSSVPQVFPDDSIRHSLCLFVNSYLDAFDAGPPRKGIHEFYSSDAYLTFQIAPYLLEDVWRTSCDKKAGLEAPHGWRTYERFASNLIPGALALPAWAWASLSSVVTSLPKARRPVLHLSKQEKQRLKVLRAFQCGHAKRLESVKSFASSASDRGLQGVPPPPLSRSEARGRTLAVGLLSRLPDLIHIRVDECSYLDVISSEPTGILFRYSCLAAEVLPPSSKNVEPEQQQHDTLQVGTFGTVRVRRIHRTLSVVPPSPGRIVQEDLCITPVAQSLVQTHSAVIIQTVSDRIVQRTRVADRHSVDLESPQFADVLQLSSLTGMNTRFSLQCLSECKFDLERALQAFRNAFDAGLLPPEAFVNLSN